jgi:hypothetical protein
MSLSPYSRGTRAGAIGRICLVPTLGIFCIKLDLENNLISVFLDISDMNQCGDVELGNVLSTRFLAAALRNHNSVAQVFLQAQVYLFLFLCFCSAAAIKNSNDKACRCSKCKYKDYVPGLVLTSLVRSALGNDGE